MADDLGIFEQRACIDCDRLVLCTPTYAGTVRCGDHWRVFHGALVLRAPAKVCNVCGSVDVSPYPDGWRCVEHVPDPRAYWAPVLAARDGR